MKLFRDINPSPKRQRDSPNKLDSDRPYSALSKGFSQLKSSRILLGHTPEKRDDKLSSESFKNLSNFVSESFKNKEKDRNEKFASKRLSLFDVAAENGSRFNEIKSI